MTMDTNTRDDLGGFGFGQHEPLVRRLHNLLRDYPEGVGIVKELIQNADDAGATIVRLTVDWRSHHNVEVPDPRMAGLLGPALLFYNDAKFTESDFQNIQEISFSGKSNDLGKTGRYGIGFNSVYHVSDCPSILSGERIVFFDPRCQYVPSTVAEPGRGWYYAQEGWWDRYPGFLATYEAGGLYHGVAGFEGTVFRLPLRTPEQAEGNKIRHEPFSESSVQKLLQSLENDAEALLLFLKSVLAIEVYEIDRNSSEPQLRLSLRTGNATAVDGERKKLLNAVLGGYEELTKLCEETPELLPEVTYIHEIVSLTRSGKCSSRWLVTGSLYVDPEGEILEIMEQMWEHGDKAVPWAGAAARISSTETSAKASVVSGRAFCFLPLPGMTGLPIHIHGYFDLNSSRDGISSMDGRTGQSAIGPQWNQLLVKQIIARACANLIEALSKEIGERDPREYYLQWPVQELRLKGLDGLNAGVLELLNQRPVIRSTGPQRWVSPHDIKTIPQGWGQIYDPLVADGWALPDPKIPKHIHVAFQQNDLELTEIVPEDVREYLGSVSESGMHTDLDNAPVPSLRKRPWIISLLKFCLSDDDCDLRGLPLALVADGTLERFNDNGVHYISGDDERALFANHLDWFLDPQFVKDVEDLATIDADYIVLMGIHGVVEQLHQIIEPVTEVSIPWRPDQIGLPNEKWLCTFYSYLSKQSDLKDVLEELRTIPLVPGDDGRLYKGWTVETPLNDSGIQSELRTALQNLGVVFIKAIGDLQPAITSFLKPHPYALIPPASVGNLSNHLIMTPRIRTVV